MWTGQVAALLALVPLLASGAAIQRQEKRGQTFIGKGTWNHWGGASTACGPNYPADDSKMQTALNAAQFGGLGNNSPVCGQTITITYEDKSQQATIVESGGEGWGGLDMTAALFEALIGPTTIGTKQVTWSFDSYDPGSATVAPAQQQTVARQAAVVQPSAATTPASSGGGGACQKGEMRCSGNTYQICDIRDNATKLGEWVDNTVCPTSCQMNGAIVSCV